MILRIILLVAILETEDISVSEYNICSLSKDKHYSHYISEMKRKENYVGNFIVEQTKKLQPTTLVDVKNKIKAAENY